MSFRSVIRAGRRNSESMPWWALLFYWASVACVLLFVGFIWLVTAFCMSMRPVYETRR
jgi:hypothetical protein